MTRLITYWRGGSLLRRTFPGVFTGLNSATPAHSVKQQQRRTRSTGDRAGGMELQSCVLSHWTPGSTRPNSPAGTVLSATHGSPQPLLSNIQSWYTALTLYCTYFFTPVSSKKFLEASDYVLLPNTLPEPSCTLTERWLQDSCVCTDGAGSTAENWTVWERSHVWWLHGRLERAPLIFSAYRPTGRKGKGIKNLKY